MHINDKIVPVEFPGCDFSKPFNGPAGEFSKIIEIEAVLPAIDQVADCCRLPV
jgi:hypothetical protein